MSGVVPSGSPIPPGKQGNSRRSGSKTKLVEHKPHVSTAAIPQLDSAPPSGNSVTLDAIGLPPPPVMTGTRSSASIPPPPPPPPPLPPPIIATTTPTTTSHDRPLPPPPPPPPRLPQQPPPTTATATTTSAAASDNRHNRQNTQQQQDDDDDLQSPPPPVPIDTFGPNYLKVLARRQTHIPVLIIATEAANRMAWKNKLLLHDLFQGLVMQPEFAKQTPKQQLPPFRSIHKSLTPSNVQVQFLEAQMLVPLSNDQAHHLLQHNALLQDSDGNLQQELVLLEDRVDELLQDDSQDRRHYYDTSNATNSNMLPMEQEREDLEQVTRDAFALTSPLDIPWLIRYRHALDQSTNSLPHDLINCPPLILLVCTTQEEFVSDPVDCLRELASAPPHLHLPPSFTNGLYDPNSMRREVLVLHDNVDGPAAGQWDELGLRQDLHRNFGHNAAVLRINSVMSETAKALAQQENTDLWGGKGKKGNCLSVNDRVVLRRYFQNLITNCVLPAMERRISDLNVIVSERKKGVRNVLKSFWRKPKDEPTTTSADAQDAVAKYRFDSIESQTRLLADTLFLMKDYEAALGIYRLIRDDYKSDKAMVHYANVQEMMALCLYHMDPYYGTRSKEIFSHLETALFSYTRAAEEERQQQQLQQKLEDPSASHPARPLSAPHSTRLATRLCLLISSMAAEQYQRKKPSSSTSTPAGYNFITSGRELEVADLLASASSHETPLGAAVLLEQSSAFYYRAKMYRKYAFHMLMSGHMFRTACQEHHAFRCFTSALYLYKLGNWNELHNHLRSALAAQLHTMGRMAVSLLLYAKLVGSGCEGSKVSTKSQEKFLFHLREICRDHPKKALAGADRMVAHAPTHVSSKDRDSVRKAHLNRIVDVIRYTKGAVRVLELPHIQLPHIDDSSLQIWTKADHVTSCKIQRDDEDEADDENSVEHPISSTRSFGRLEEGEDSIWEELAVATTAELKAVSSLSSSLLGFSASSSKQMRKSASGMDDDAALTTKALASIQDPMIRKVIAEMDKENAIRDREKRAARRRKEKAGSTSKGPVRARMEPLCVDFVIRNPLNVEIQVNDLQLVARMKKQTKSSDNEELQQTCTNQDAIRIAPTASNNEAAPRRWTFPGMSHLVFEAAEFCRVSSLEDKKGRVWKSADAGGDEQPFYVVTKTDLTLPPLGSKTVSIGLTPLVEGELEILGVRCQLFEEVWIYHAFATENTRRNTLVGKKNIDKVHPDKASLLKANVEVDMPCLVAELNSRNSCSTQSLSTLVSQPTSGDDPKLLEGQVSDWMIRLSNIGNAEASNITLKSNMPWVNIVSAPASPLEGVAREGQPTSNCIGPSGTLMALPVQGVIKPGETVEIPIQVRTTGLGKQCFYMLYRYELWNSNEDSGKEPSRHRWLRKMYEITVHPSLRLSASLTSSYWNDAGYILSVEVTNHRNDKQNDLSIKLDKLSMASRYYRLEALHGQCGSSATSTSEDKVLLGWQERLTVHYRVVPSEPENEQKDCFISESPFTKGGPGSSSIQDCVTSSATSFLCLERAFEIFEDAWRSHKLELVRLEHSQDGEKQHPRSIAQIRRANTADIDSADRNAQSSDGADSTMAKSFHPTSIGKLCPAESSVSKVAISCSWSATADGDQYGPFIWGEHHIRELLVRPTSKEAHQTCQVTATANHPRCVMHNFRDGPALVPWQVTLKNQMVDSKVVFELVIEQSPTFDFVGLQCGRMSLKGGEEVTVPMQALIHRAGVHNLQMLKLFIGDEDSDHQDHPRPYRFTQSEWLVTVTDRE